MATKFYSTSYSIEKLHYYLEQVELAAKLQEISEVQFNALVLVAKQGITLVETLQEGQVVSHNWILWRDTFIEEAKNFILDCPETEE